MLTTKQYYGGRNRRFDKRARLLRRFGYQYRIVPIESEWGRGTTIAVFARSKIGRTQAITASELWHADSRVWQERLENLLRR